MNLRQMEQQLDELNQRLRIIILQNVREEEGYDEEFLFEMNQITRQILSLKQFMNKHTGSNPVLRNDLYASQLTRH